VESKKASYPGDLVSADTGLIDPAQLAKVKEILIVLANAVSAAKIFPSEHQTVVSFASDLESKFKEYLDAYWKLELGIGEQAFTFAGKKVYEDPHPVRSLPFFFFKDGMKMLYFYRGLEKEELMAFLRAIKKVSQLPPEEGDTVNALWEEDLANIRYDAPDDFLETRIGVGKPPLELRVDREKLVGGRIDLAPEDLDALCSSALPVEASVIKPAEESAGEGQADVASEPDASDEREMREIESLLLSSRQVSPEEEYSDLIIEIAYLEDRADQFPAVADALKQHHRETVKKNDFKRAARFLQSLHEIRDAFATTNEQRAAFLEAVLAEISQESLIAELPESLDFSQVKDIDSLLSYLRLIGPSAARSVAAVFDHSSDERQRRAALDVLEEISRLDSSAVMSLAQESRPALTREIIGLINRSRDKKIISYLAGFLRYRNKSIKLEAVKTLGEIDDDAAGKILIGFLSDEDEEVRTASARALKPVQKAVLDHLLALVQDKAFKKKTRTERGAIFEALARSNSEEAYDLLRKTLKTPFFPNAEKTEMAIIAASVLRKMATPLAKEALQDGAKGRSRKVREACLRSLADLSARGNPSPPPGMNE
jgi:HEAT repeat protein